MSECTNGELRDLLPEFVNGGLGAQMQREVEAHVAGCEECAEELVLLRALRPALMRGPKIDSARIAAAVRAQMPAPARRDLSRRQLPWRLAIAAAALVAVSAVGYAIAMRGRSAAPEIAIAPTPAVLAPDTPKKRVVRAPALEPKAPAPRTTVTPAPPQQVAVASPRVEPSAAGVLDNVSDLSDDDVRTLTASLDGLSAVPSVETSPEIDPLGASLDDLSGGGLR